MIENNIMHEQPILIATPQDETLAPLVAVIRTILQQSPSSCHPYQVMSQIEDRPFDLVIFDMHNNAEMLPLIRNFKQRHALIPLIAMVPYGDVHLIEQVMVHGADDYISQPISLERLKATLRNALRMRMLMVNATGESLTALNALGSNGVRGIMPLLDKTGNLKTLREIEDIVIEHAVAACDGCITQAARALGIGRSTLYRKMQEYAQSTNGLQGAAPISEKVS